MLERWTPRIVLLGIAVAVAALGGSVFGGVVDRTSSEASATEPDRPRWASVQIEGIPHVRQKPDYCGEAKRSCVDTEPTEPVTHGTTSSGRRRSTIFALRI